MRALVVLLALAANGCDSNCVDGICPYSDETRSFIGPCRSSSSGDFVESSCTYAYDDAGHPSQIDCGDTARYTWDADAIVGIETEREGRVTTWAFDERYVTVSSGLLYDRATFALLPLLGDGLAYPRALLGLISDAGSTYTWMDAPPNERIRTDADGMALRFVIDERGRVTATYEYRGTTTQTLQHETFSFAGDRLEAYGQFNGTDWSHTYFHYDRGGNLTDEEHTFDQRAPDEVIARTVYDYSCWY